eukprot:1890451-Pyramimonas_sp.AAC.1
MPWPRGSPRPRGFSTLVGCACSSGSPSSGGSDSTGGRECPSAATATDNLTSAWGIPPPRALPARPRGWSRGGARMSAFVANQAA